ncbi:hypothetical protein BJ170DRAFT_459583 [Xylariales sp. AK1849]|nr:hypothetical protein BJ170DRAFT_459583 [Xylariales sp. AK1849]
MEVVGATASVIAIGQALAAIPKIIRAVQSIANVREELHDLLFQLDILTSMYDEVQRCFDQALSDQSPGPFDQKEPAYIQRLRSELDGLLTKLPILARDCQMVEAERRLPTTVRAKWVWKKQKVTDLCDKARRIQGYLQSAIQMLAFRQSLTQNRLLVEIHAFTTRPRPICDSTSSSGVEHSSPEAPASRSILGNQTDLLESDRCSPHSYGLWNYQRPPCICSCHARGSVTTTGSGTRAGSSWLATLSSPNWALFGCSGCNCRSSCTRFGFDYNLPQWIAKRKIVFAAGINFKNGIGITLRFPVVLEYCPLWNLPYEGGDQSALDWATKHSITPLDSSNYGESILVVNSYHRIKEELVD